MPLIVNMDSEVDPTLLGEVLGMSRGGVYNDIKSGKFGPKGLTSTWKEALTEHRKYLLSRESSTKANIDIDLMERQLLQKLRADRASEVKSWLIIAEKRKKLLIEEELLRLYEPFIHIIKNAVVSISLDYPETRDRVDDILNTVADFGRTMMRQGEEDAEHFLAAMLEKQVDDDLLELTFIPEHLAVKQ